MLNIKTITTLIKQGLITPVRQLFCASPITYLDIWCYLGHSSKLWISIFCIIFWRFQARNWKTYLPGWSRDAIIAPQPSRSTQVSIWIQPPIMTRHLNHIGDNLDFAVLDDNIPLVSFILSQAGTDPNKDLLHILGIMKCWNYSWSMALG